MKSEAAYNFCHLYAVECYYIIFDSHTMSTTYELLQELDMTLRQLQPYLVTQDDQGNVLHPEIVLGTPDEIIQQLISELKVYASAPDNH